MAGIPRIEQGSLPGSAVPQGAPETGEAGARMIGAVGDLARTGAGIAAEYEKQAQEALDRKQQITDAVEIGRRSAEFESSLRATIEEMKARPDIWNNPRAAEAEFLARAQDDINFEVEQATKYNDRVGLGMARETSATRDALRHEVRTWISLRETQKAKTDMEDVINQVAAQAGTLASPAALTRHIDTALAKHSSRLDATYGADADAKKRLLRERSTLAFYLNRTEKSPVHAAEELQSGTGPSTILPPEKRDELLRRARNSRDGRQLVNEDAMLASAAGKTKELVEHLDAGTLTWEMVSRMKDAHEEQLRAVASNPEYTVAEKAAYTKQLNEQIKTIDAIEDIRMRGVTFRAEDQISAGEAAVESLNKTLKKLKGQNDFAVLVQQQRDITRLRHEGKISAGHFNTLMQTVNRAVEHTLTASAQDTGWLWNSGRQAGNEAMATIFTTSIAKNATPQQRLDSWMDFTDAYNAATKDGSKLTNEQVEDLAYKAVSYRTGLKVQKK